MKFAVKAVTGGKALAVISIFSSVALMALVQTPKTISSIGGLHQMLGLREYGFVVVARDSVRSLPEFDSTNRFGASFETPCGRRWVKPVVYMEMISSMRPNLWTTLADEVPAWVSDKRNKTSVDRTCWFRQVELFLDPLLVDLTLRNGSDVPKRNVSGNYPCLCQQSSIKSSIESHIIHAGYWIEGFGLAESMDDSPPLLNAVTDNLPEERPRLIYGLGLPEEVMQGIAAGVDLFDSVYIYHLTLGGFALVFPLDGMETSDIGSDGTKINLRATMYR
ncbi:hypothetical protein EZV62_022628 [Acer yangbiense]|uniref:tRNA-guanine(15) transglycosylase-like domain-containing protein n=1 Tax=Acer yangbiense TaxID=1000413 RepID=A0A5C7H9N8_9ROSI|nr:hypothetical protein EZV62_022628 [Acer yangbiense]